MREPWPIIENALSGSFPAEGERFSPELFPGLSPEQFDLYAASFSTPVPKAIKNLLLNTTGFGYYSLNQIRFDHAQGSGNVPLLPDSVLICNDEQGTRWLADIDKQTGDWSTIYAVNMANSICAVQANDLSGFLDQLFHTVASKVNWLAHIREKVLPDLQSNTPPGMDMVTAGKNADISLRTLARNLPTTAVLFDMRKAQPGDGFCWGKGKIQATTQKGVFAVIPEKRPFWKRWFS